MAATETGRPQSPKHGPRALRRSLTPVPRPRLQASARRQGRARWPRTFLLVLQKMTAWVMVSVSYRSHKVSNFHSSLSTATKNCLMPSKVNSSLEDKDRPCHSLFERRLEGGRGPGRPRAPMGWLRTGGPAHPAVPTPTARALDAATSTCASERSAPLVPRR